MDNTRQSPKSEATRVAVIGAGLIGCSWASLFAASRMSVAIYDPRPDTGEIIRDFWQNVRPALIELGLARAEDAEPVFDTCGTIEEAVTGALVVKECIPERLEMKQGLYREIEPSLMPGAIVATSSSGLKLSDLQALWANPGRLIIAHPFNPPHIVPLVELYANDRTDKDVLPAAKEFFESVGKVTITLKREVMGHVANRLQAALWREAIHLVAEDVASVEDVDTAIWAGPGLRWSVMGPHMLLNLGGGEQGIRAYCDQFAQSYTEWWADLGDPKMDAATIDALAAGIGAEVGDRDYTTLRKERDAKLVAVLRAIRSAQQSLTAKPVPA